MNFTIGIFGQGSFGKWFGQRLAAAGFIVSAYDKTALDNRTLPRVLASDVIILAIPLASYPEWLTEHGTKISDSSVVMDVCSVKEKPLALLREQLPAAVKILATHPLFGPESAKTTTAGHKLVVCEGRGDTGQIASAIANALELEIINRTAQEHDQTMAKVHALTFYIARALTQLDLPLEDNELITPSYKKLLALAELERHHSPALYDSIQHGNPYAREVRRQLRELLIELD